MEMTNKARKNSVLGFGILLGIVIIVAPCRGLAMSTSVPDVATNTDVSFSSDHPENQYVSKIEEANGLIEMADYLVLASQFDETGISIPSFLRQKMPFPAETDGPAPGIRGSVTFKKIRIKGMNLRRARTLSWRDLTPEEVGELAIENQNISEVPRIEGLISFRKIGVDLRVEIDLGRGRKQVVDVEVDLHTTRIPYEVELPLEKPLMWHISPPSQRDLLDIGEVRVGIKGLPPGLTRQLSKSLQPMLHDFVINAISPGFKLAPGEATGGGLGF